MRTRPRGPLTPTSGRRSDRISPRRRSPMVVGPDPRRAYSTMLRCEYEGAFLERDHALRHRRIAASLAVAAVALCPRRVRRRVGLCRSQRRRGRCRTPRFGGALLRDTDAVVSSASPPRARVPRGRNAAIDASSRWPARGRPTIYCSHDSRAASAVAHPSLRRARVCAGLGGARPRPASASHGRRAPRGFDSRKDHSREPLPGALRRALSSPRSAARALRRHRATRCALPAARDRARGGRGRRLDDAEAIVLDRPSRASSSPSFSGPRWRGPSTTRGPRRW